MAQFSFDATTVSWRGPSPFFFAPLPLDCANEIRRLSRLVTYGWGMAPVQVKIGETAFKTSLFAKDGTYLLPLKAEVRRQAGVTAGDTVAVDMVVLLPQR